MQESQHLEFKRPWKLEPNGLWVVFELESTKQQQEVDDSGRFRTIPDDIRVQIHEEKILLKYLIQNKKITRQVAMELLKLKKSQTFEILNALVEKMTRPVWQIMHRLPMFANALRGDLTQSEIAEARLVNLPSSPAL